jgi:geranylgeranyl pyrophosphate synthase
MDYYPVRKSFIKEALLELPDLPSWPDLLSVFAREDADEPVRLDWQLPVLACRAVGSPPELALSAAAAFACLQISIMLVDDMLDEDPRGEHRRLGAGRTANLSLAYEAAAHALILRSPASDSARSSAGEALALAALGTAFGQELDVANLSGEENYWRVVRAKSTPFYGAALQVGALLGGADKGLARSLYGVGVQIGEMIQVYDDLVDAFEEPANPDWREGRNNLSLLYASKAEHSDRDSFLDLAGKVDEPGILAAAQRILISSGAVSYCVYLWQERYQAAASALDQLGLPNPAPLEEALYLQLDPLTRWLSSVGVPLPEELGPVVR